MNAHDCSNRLKDWISKNCYDTEGCHVINVDEIIDELNQMEFDESGDEE